MAVTSISERPLRVGEAAAALGLPGPWTLHRLEERKLIPAARRTSVSKERYYPQAEIPVLAELIRLRSEGQK